MSRFARYKWPFALILAGAVLHLLTLGVFVFSLLRDTGSSFAGPGRSTVAVAKPGNYTLWVENRGFADGKLTSFPLDLPPGMTIKALKLPECKEVSLRRGGAYGMQSGDFQRNAVAELTLDTPGDYEFVVGGTQEKRSFYLSKDKFFGLLLLFLLGGGTGALLFVSGVISGLFISFRERRVAFGGGGF